MEKGFIQKYSSKIQGQISCFDRVVIKGTLHSVGHVGAVTNLLYRKGVLLKDFKSFIAPYRNALHQTAKQIAKQEGIEIEFIRNSRKVRKEDIVQRHLAQRTVETGLVCILSAMESCQNYEYRYNKSNGQSYMQMTSGKCLHYYYYFIDPSFGLCYLRVPTWCPFRLQFYFNGHNWLANELKKAGIDFVLEDNAFTYLADYEKAQAICDGFRVKQLHDCLETYTARCCPVAAQLCRLGYHWSIMQAEYATDIVFKDNRTVGKIYDDLLNTLMHSVQPDDVAKFLGRKKLHGKNNLELETTTKQVRHQMRRIKHRMGACSIKMYDKFSKVLRIETTTNNPSEFSHYRSVEHRDGTKTSKVAPVKKNIYSLKALSTIMGYCNQRYLKYIAAFDQPTIGKKRLQKMSSNTKVNDRTYKGFNLFDKDDEHILKTIASGDFILNGFRNKHIKEKIPNKSTGQISRIIKRLKVKGLIKRAGKSYKYFITTLGMKIIATALNFKELLVQKRLSY